MMQTSTLETTSVLVDSHQQKHQKAQGVIGPEQLARQIKQARQQQNLTLKALSDRCDIAPSTISKIENNQLSPTFQLLQSLITALGIKPPQLFAPTLADTRLSRRALTRRDEGVLHSTPSYQHRLLANELSQKKLLPFTSIIHARSLDSFDDWVRHQGEEFLLVLNGSVELHCECYEPVRLEVGDSSYLDSTMGHALISVSKQDAEVLWVASLM
ncbi:MAG: helix-turn-helix domain-containing protein [Motiliproteus sp.]